MLNVVQRQMNLKFLGYYEGKIDGLVGNGTISAYENFQRDYGLVVDGIYGPKTDAKLVEVIKEEQRKYGVYPDGIAGPITNNARDNYSLSWDNIKYFKKEEFTCKCGCGLNNINLKLVQILDEIRERLGCPVIVTSGTRCSRHNKEVQGVADSRHVRGKASDIVATVGTKDRVLSICKEYVASGRARYTYTNNTNMGNAVHIDIE